MTIGFAIRFFETKILMRPCKSEIASNSGIVSCFPPADTTIYNLSLKTEKSYEEEMSFPWYLVFFE